MPVAGFVVGGPGAPVKPGQFDLPDASEPYDRASYEFRVRVPAFGTVALLHFAAQRAPENLEDLRQQLQALANLSDPNALAGLTAQQKALIRNFIVP